MAKKRYHSACELARLMAKEWGIERTPNTIRAWMLKGCRVGRKQTGKLIKLEHKPIGGQLCSTMEAIDEFLNALGGD